MQAEQRELLTRELESIASSAVAQGWDVVNNSNKVLRLRSRRGLVHELFRGPDPVENRVRLRQFAHELRAAGLRVNRTVRRPIDDRD